MNGRSNAAKLALRRTVIVKPYTFTMFWISPVNLLTLFRFSFSQFLAVGIRYGKFCGVGWTGCPGEKPCDDLDACCKIHDECVEKKGNFNALVLVIYLYFWNISCANKNRIFMEHWSICWFLQRNLTLLCCWWHNRIYSSDLI